MYSVGRSPKRELAARLSTQTRCGTSPACGCQMQLGAGAVLLVRNAGSWTGTRLVVEAAAGGLISVCAAETMGISDQKNLDEAVGLLRQSSMFHACSKETLAKMARDMDRLDFTKGDNLLDQGAPQNKAFFIADGSIKRERVVNDQSHQVKDVSGERVAGGERSLLTLQLRCCAVTGHRCLRQHGARQVRQPQGRHRRPARSAPGVQGAVGSGLGLRG